MVVAKARGYTRRQLRTDHWTRIQALEGVDRSIRTPCGLDRIFHLLMLCAGELVLLPARLLIVYWTVECLYTTSTAYTLGKNRGCTGAIRARG